MILKKIANNVFKELDFDERANAFKLANKLIKGWEEVPQEDLWEDGELDSEQVKEKIYQEVVRQGEWKLIREVE